MEKIDITTEQWIEIHKTLRDKMPVWFIPHLKDIFEIHSNKKMINSMQEIRRSIRDSKEL